MKKNIFLLFIILYGGFSPAFGEIVTMPSPPPRVLESVEKSEEIGVLTPTPKQNSSDFNPVKQQQYILQQQGSTFVVVPVVSGAYMPAPSIASNEISSSRKTLERNMNKARTYSHANENLSGIMGKDGVVLFPCEDNMRVAGKFFITLNGRATPARCR